MQPSDILRVRTEMAREMGVKAEAMRQACLNESLRYEGATGALQQAVDAIDMELHANKEALLAGQTEDVTAQAVRTSLLLAHGRITVILRAAESGLAGQRGKLQQAEETLNMLEALFSADIEAAKAIIAPTPPAPPAKPGRHPGPSLAAKRRAEGAKPAEAKAAT